MSGLTIRHLRLGSGLAMWIYIACHFLNHSLGLISLGAAERGPAGVEAIRKHKSAYLMAVGGAAYLVSKAIKHASVVGFGDLGMEAIYEFDVTDMPVTVAVDSNGTSVHDTGPREWEARIKSGIGRIPVAAA